MSYISRYDQKGPLSQEIDINYGFLPDNIKPLFKEYVRAEFQVLINEIKSQTPIASGNLLNSWNFKMSLTNGEIKVQIKNSADYSNYITSGSSIYTGDRFLEIAMARFERDVLQEIVDLI